MLDGVSQNLETVKLRVNTFKNKMKNVVKKYVILQRENQVLANNFGFVTLCGFVSRFAT